VFGTFTITTTGTPAPSINAIGALPAGVNVVDNGDGTATLSGTPQSGSAGSYPLTFTANNLVGTPATQNFTLSVANNATGTPIFTSAPSTTFTVGVAGTFTITTAAVPAVTSITKVGGLATGLNFVDNGNGTATVSGTPAANTAGLYVVTLFAIGPGGQTVQTFSVKVLEAASI